MAKRPSLRSKRNRGTDELQLTSIMDIITTMMFFLLIYANIIPICIIDAPLPKIAETAAEVRQAEKKDDKKLEINVGITSQGFTVSSNRGASKQFPLLDGKYPYDELHKHLVVMKTNAKDATEITLNPSDDVIYDTIILTMDASRELYKDDPGFQEVPPDIATSPEALRFNRLFPDVNLGGI